MFISIRCMTHYEKSHKIEPITRHININNITYYRGVDNQDFRTVMKMNSGELIYSKTNITQLKKKIKKGED